MPIGVRGGNGDAGDVAMGDAGTATAMKSANANASAKRHATPSTSSPNSDGFINLDSSLLSSPTTGPGRSNNVPTAPRNTTTAP